jgi:ribosome-binding factor A
MSSANADIYSNRVGLVGASLLAVVVNQQFADQKIGQSTTVTLVDMLHMLGFCTVFIIFIGSLISRKLSLSKNMKFSPKEFDLITFVVMTAIYLTANIFIIYRAIHNG